MSVCVGSGAAADRLAVAEHGGARVDAVRVLLVLGARDVEAVVRGVAAVRQRADARRAHLVRVRARVRVRVRVRLRVRVRVRVS